MPLRGESSDEYPGVGWIHSSDEVVVMTTERRNPVVRCAGEAIRNERTDSAHTKPFQVSKREVFDAWKRTRANQGAAGVDQESLEQFESNLGSNLYVIWNRMSSGTYFPEAVRRVEIPKANGSKRTLGIPTVRDRVAQEVVRARLEPILEPEFHPDS